jgi:hypothetical protein
MSTSTDIGTEIGRTARTENDMKSHFGLRSSRFVACVIAVIVASIAIATSAHAADYDSASGFLQTPSGATATAGLQCGNSAVLILQRGYTAPQLMSYRATNSLGQTTGWMPWQTFNGGMVLTVVTRPGYWTVQVQIAHSTSSGWKLDQEFAPVSSQAGTYRDRFWCNVLG